MKFETVEEYIRRGGIVRRVAPGAASTVPRWLSHLIGGAIVDGGVAELCKDTRDPSYRASNDSVFGRRRFGRKGAK